MHVLLCFVGYHESIGPVKESAVWVEEAAPPSLPWGRRPMSPATYTPPDPLGLSTEGDECKFPEEELLELFPDGYIYIMKSQYIYCLEDAI